MRTAEPYIDTTVVVCTCSRVALLRQALGSLLQQSWARDHRLELVVVDDGSTDGTAAFLLGFQRHCPWPMQIVDGPKAGIAAARNTGFRAARGTWIGSFDDDQIADPDWLRALRLRAEASGVQALGGALSLLLPADVPQRQLGRRVRAVLGEHAPFGTAQPYSRGFHPATNNALLRRELFHNSAGFDIRFTEGGEDKEFFQRLAATGHTLWFEPAACAGHITPAHRLQVSNLRWTSLRLGAADARLAMLKGRGRALRTVAARAAVTLLRDVPAMPFARAVQRLDLRCSIWYTEGLVRGLVQLWRPRRAGSRFLRSLDFRGRNGERAVLSAASASSAQTAQTPAP